MTNEHFKAIYELVDSLAGSVNMLDEDAISCSMLIDYDAEMIARLARQLGYSVAVYREQVNIYGEV